MSSDTAAEPEPDLKLEIGHVLTIDVVAYSTLLIHEQTAVMADLNRVVRNAARFRTAEAANKLTRLPTGDGMALVFFGDPEAPLECAMQISAELKTRPDLRLRMGIHSGPINKILDVNDRSNVAGAGIDMAQRVMDCGDAGHILVSRRVADDLAPYSRWSRFLHDLGECEVKHGRRVSLVNFYTDSVGNPAVPTRLKARAETARAVAGARRRKHLLIAVAAAVAAAAVAATIWWWNTPVPVARRSVAVLPFLDLSQSKDQEYFSDGITEQIINSVSKVRGLLVVARTSVFTFKNKATDIREVGRRLQCTHVIEGSVSRGTGRVRVDARLVDVRSGYQLWSQTYDSEDRDVLSLQSDIARKVASALQIELQLAEREQLTRSATENSQAYDLYLRGRYLLNKRTPESIQKARELFEQTVAADSRFAPGYVGIADAYILLAEYGVMQTAEASKAAWPQVHAALKIDDDLADAHVSRAMLLAHFEWDWAAGEAAYRRALELNPNNARAHHWYALHLGELGRYEEGLAEIDVAKEHDPLAPIVRAAKGKLLFLARRYDEAIREFQQALELEPKFAPALAVMGQVYVSQGRFDEAIRTTRTYVEASGGGESTLELAYVYAAAGRFVEAEEIVRQFAAAGTIGRYDQATICSAAGDESGALRWLGEAIDNRSISVVWARVDPRLDKIRTHPRFRELLARLSPRDR